MKFTQFFSFRKPDREDYVKVDDFNFNFDKLDDKLKNVDMTLTQKANINSPDFIGTPTIEGDEIVTKTYITNKLTVKEI